MATKPARATLTIAGTAIEVGLEQVTLADLSLDPQNPRIRLAMSVTPRKKAPSAEEVAELIRAQPGFEALQRQVRNDGGIYEPLIVRHDGHIVEGNTRYTVLSVLAKTPGGQEKWGNRIPIMRLPADVPEKIVQLQMAGYHVSGKTKWRAASQADQIYRLIEEVQATPEEVATVTRSSPKEVAQVIDAYKYLVKEVLPELKDASPAEKRAVLDTKFSHALEFIKRRDLQSAREDKVQRKKVAKLIAEDKIQGAEVRKLKPLLDNPRASQALERSGFKAAKEELRRADPTAESTLLKAVRKLTGNLDDLDQKNMALFRDHLEAYEALQALVESAQNVLSLRNQRGRRRA
jgi:hypothetical protein